MIVADPDPAGRQLAAVLTDHLAAHGVDAVSVAPPAGLDLNAWALADPDWHLQLDSQLGDIGVEPGLGVEVGGPEL